MGNFQLHDFCEIIEDCLLVYTGTIVERDASNY